MELWDVYDASGRKQPGTLVRGEPIPPGSYHLVSCIVVRHEDGDFLLMKRAPTKEHYPNIWEIGAGGSVLQGETAGEAARRELAEETGITEGDWSYLSRYVEGNTIYEGFLCVTMQEKHSVRLQEGETVDYRWLSPREFLTFFYSDHCIPRFKNRLNKYVKAVEASVSGKCALCDPLQKA